MLSDIPWVPPVLLTCSCMAALVGCSGEGLRWDGSRGGAGAGAPALASDPSVMGDSSGSGPTGPPCDGRGG